MKNNLSRPIIFELIGRLPGPLANHHLQNYGYRIIKVEHSEKRDPFQIKADHDLNKLFNCWYEQINIEKNILLVDDSNFKSKINLEMEKFSDQIANGVIIVEPNKNHSLHNFSNYLITILKEKKIPYKVIAIDSDQYGTPIHDLDLATEIGLTNSKNNTPPKYPVMGIIFSFQLAMKINNSLLQNDREIFYFKNDLLNLFELFKSPFEVLPIEGKFIGYNTYELSDGKISLTSLEKRNWVNFISKLQIELGENDFLKNTESEECRFFKVQLKKLSVQQLITTFPNPTEKCFSIINF